MSHLIFQETTDMLEKGRGKSLASGRLQYRKLKDVNVTDYSQPNPKVATQKPVQVNEVERAQVMDNTGDSLEAVSDLLSTKKKKKKPKKNNENKKRKLKQKKKNSNFVQLSKSRLRREARHRNWRRVYESKD